MKIMSIVGARPQFIKLAPLSKKLREHYNEVIVHTGQHSDAEMSGSFFADLEIDLPDHELNINGGSHGEQTGKMLIEIEKVIKAEKPEIVIVFGDTNSTLAGALAASKLQIPVIHIEAGLRSFNRAMPEEVNRIITDHISGILMAPTETAMNNLKSENLSDNSYLTGDIMVDSLTNALEKCNMQEVLDRFGLQPNGYFLTTLHRPGNVDRPERLTNILSELGKLSKNVIFPLHPRTNKVIQNSGITVPENIELVKPVGYLDFVALQNNSYKIITDSGGIQKEAYFLKKTCITLRGETEWVETVKAGANLLIDVDTETNFAYKIESFFAADDFPPIYSENVAEKMVGLIDELDIESLGAAHRSKSVL